MTGGSVHAEDPMGMEYTLPQGEDGQRPRHLAARHVARNCRSLTDCGWMLAALGLSPEEGLTENEP